MKHSLIFAITVIALMVLPPAALGLEKDIEVDILTTRITGLLKEGKNADALPLFEKLEGMNVKLPESFDFYYIDTLDKAGNAAKAVERSEAYLKKYGKKGKYYAQVIEIVGRRSVDAEKERKAAEVKARADQAAAEAKARSDQARQFRDEARRYAETGETEKVATLLAGANGILVDSGDDAIKRLAEQMKALYSKFGTHYAGRYRDNRDGTVTDNITNKIWKRCLEGQTWSQKDFQCEGKPSLDTWPSVENVSKPWYAPTKAEVVQELMFCGKDLNAKPNQDGRCPGDERANINPIAFRFLSSPRSDSGYIFTTTDLPDRDVEYDCKNGGRFVTIEEGWSFAISNFRDSSIYFYKAKKRAKSCRGKDGLDYSFNASSAALLLYRFPK